MELYKSKKFLLFSLLGLFLFLFSVSVKGTLVNLFFCIYLFRYISKNKRICNNIDVLFSSFFVELLLSYFFYRKWIGSEIVSGIANSLGITHISFIITISLILMFISFFAVYSFLGYFKVDYYQNKNHSIENLASNGFALFICFLVAICIVTICSKSSFIYPFNDWDDSNCYFTVGKGMVNGMVPYRDLFEQKGPLLYLIHGFAWFISHDSFFGIYCFQIILNAVSLFYLYKTMRLFLVKDVIHSVPVLCLALLVAKAYVAGDSAEEFSFPFLTVSLYIIIKALVLEKDLTINEYLIIGFCSGCIFWMKFSLIGSYIGWFLFFLICSIIERKIRGIIESIIFIGLGVFISTLPFIIYFGLNHAINDWYEVYLYNNLFLYGNKSSSIILSLVMAMNEGFISFMEYNPIICNLCFIGFIACLALKNKAFACAAVMMFFEFFFIFAGGIHQRYYSYDMGIFSIFGIIAIYVLLDKIVSINKHLIYAELLLCSLLAYYLTPNKYLIGTDKMEMPQYKFKEIILQDDNPTILNYGFLDGGFYTVSNIFPNCRYFCQIYMDIPDMFDTQNYYVDNGLCDYVITRSYESFDRYDLLEQTEWYYNENYKTYYLYKLKN